MLSALTVLWITSIQSATDPTKRLEQITTSALAEYDLPCVYAGISINGKVVAVSAVGSRSSKKVMTPALTDPLKIGSVSKVFTNTMIASLIERGDLNWDSTLEDLHLLDLQDSQLTRTPVKLLMRHLSGYPRSYDGRVVPANGDSPETFLARVVRAWSRTKHVSMMNEAELYSGVGSDALAFMASCRVGKSYEELMKSHVFEPLKLESAGLGFPSVDAAHSPLGYSRRDDGTETEWTDEHFRTVEWDYIQGLKFKMPAGSVHCSIRDLLKFGTSFLSGTEGVLSDRARTRMLEQVSGRDHSLGGWLCYFRGPWRRHEGCTGTGDGTTLMIHPAKRIVYAYWISVDKGFGGGIPTPKLDEQIRALAERLADRSGN
jgi:CubicO group peptidase (beta-lactamase class C family)